jgi:hypothetical protein
MIRKIGPPTFFVTFTIGVNNWFILMLTLKDLHFKHFQHNGKMISNDLLTDRDFIRNVPITCLHYYEHKTNCFCKLLKKTKILFGKVED